MKFIYSILILLFIFSCTNERVGTVAPDPIVLNKDKMDYLYQFAFECIDQEYPNKMGHVMGDSTSLVTPSQAHPAFYGCFDWHSAVHGHWTLVNILMRYPDLEDFDAVLEKLSYNLSRDNILKEVEYWSDAHNKSFERTYGWVWLLKLDEALGMWEHPKAKELKSNLAPLTQLMEEKLIEFLPKLTYPIRVGEHPNTAFALSFAIDYARSENRADLEALIIKRSREYYLEDAGCPLSWEPGGFDFLSPCLQEASLMSKVLNKDEYKTWISRFMLDLSSDNFESALRPADVSDRSDGKLSHLDGLNFSRAWCLYEIADKMDDNSIISLANDHFNTSYDKISSDEYAGAHWLASFAIYALIKSEESFSEPNEN